MAAQKVSPEMAQALKESEERLKHNGATHRGNNRVLEMKYIPETNESLLDMISQSVLKKCYFANLRTMMWIMAM